MGRKKGRRSYSKGTSSSSGGGTKSGKKSGPKGKKGGPGGSKGPSSSSGGGTKSGKKSGPKGKKGGPGGPTGPSGSSMSGPSGFSTAVSGFASSLGFSTTQATSYAQSLGFGSPTTQSGITVSQAITATKEGQEMSGRQHKFTLKTKHITKEGGFDFVAATKNFFAATPFSILPSAAAESDSTNLGINVGDGYLVNGAGDMQDKAAQGLSNIAGMLDSDANKATIQSWKDNQQKDAEGNTVISQGTWKHLQSLKGLDSAAQPAAGSGYVIGTTTVTGHADYMEKQVIRPIKDVDPLGTWHYNYMQKFPDLYVPKQSAVGVKMPAGIWKQLERWQGYADAYEQGSVIPAHPVTGKLQTPGTVYAMINLYTNLTKDIRYATVDGKEVAYHVPVHTAVQSGMTGEFTLGGTPVRFNQDGTRLIISKADVSLAGQLITNPDSLSADQKKEAKVIQAKLDQSHYQFQTDDEGYTKYDPSKDTVGDPYHNMNVMGYDTGVWSTPKTVKREDIVWGDNDEYVSGGGLIYTHETEVGTIESTSQYIDKATGEAFTPAYDATSIDTSKYSIGEYQYVDRPASTVAGGKKGDFGVQPIGTVVSEKHTDPKTGMVSVALSAMEKAQLKLTHETGQDTFNPDGSLFATKKQPVVGSLSEWVQVGGNPSGVITSKDEYLRQKYTIGGGGGKKSVIPSYWGPRETIAMIDSNNDGTPDMLQIAPWTDSTHVSARDPNYVPPGGWGVGGGGDGSGGGGEAPGMPPGPPRQPDPYEVPYYVDIQKAQDMLEAGMTIEDIMARPPLSSDYMYWTDPLDKKEYVMTLTDYQEYLDAMATRKKVEKQQKYEQVFMDVTRSSHRPQTQIRRRKSASASANIGRVMSGSAPSEADIGGLVK